MQIPVTEHTRRPWRIHAITQDFRVEDVWSYRTPGAGPDDFPRMLAALRARGGPRHQSWATRILFDLRWRLGGLLGWDRREQALGHRVPSLVDRLTGDLAQAPRGETGPDNPFSPVFELADECALELANQTVHTICHLGWVRTATGAYELRMAALVKPNGLFGEAYLAAIKPFRHLVVYPALTRQWERAWRDHRPAETPG